VLNPLALGVTLAGLMLDILVPRPKPRVGVVPLLEAADPRTARASGVASSRAGG
jgi:hypothetical protein